MTERDITTAYLYEAYERGGVSGVVEWVEKNHPEWPRAYCVPCEEETYTWPKNGEHDDCCAVCWTARHP
jgi:hypothetical protein